MRTLTIRAKVILAVLAVMACGFGATVWALQGSFEEATRVAAADAVTSARSAFSGVREARTEKLYALLDVLTTDEKLTATFASRDRVALAEMTGPRFEGLKKRQDVTRWYFYLPQDDPRVFLRAYLGEKALDPAEYGDITDRPTYYQAVKANGPVSGFELGKTALALRAAAPHYDKDGKLIGYMAVGEEIGDFLSLVSKQTGDDYAFFLAKESFDATGWASAREKSGLRNNWDDSKEVVLADTTKNLSEASLSLPLKSIPDEGTVLGEDSVDGRKFVRGVFPVYEAGGKKVGAVLVRHDVSHVLATLRTAQNNVLMLLTALMAVVAVVIVLMLKSLVFDRLETMKAHMEIVGLNLAGGNFDLPVLPVGPQDEIGKLETFFTKLLAAVASTLRTFQASAGRDVSSSDAETAVGSSDARGGSAG